MKYYLAPMEGITNYIFRNVYHACFPGMDKYFTPFLSSNQTGKLSFREEQDIAPENNQGMYVVPQILSNNATDFIRMAKKLQAIGYQEININLGCPAKTVVSKGRGSGFLAYPMEVDQYLYEIFSGLNMKISVKTRLGKERPEEFEQLLDIYNRYPMEELIIHPRVQKDYYNNTPRMEIFQQAFKKSRNPVCYNGDIFCAEDKIQLEHQFPNLPAVMIGRGIVANPGLLYSLKKSRNCSENTIFSDEMESLKKQLKEFHDRLYDACCQAYLSSSGPKVVLFKMKEIWCYLITSFENGEKLGKKIKKAQTLDNYQAAVHAVFMECPLSCFGGFHTPSIT